MPTKRPVKQLSEEARAQIRDKIRARSKSHLVDIDWTNRPNELQFTYELEQARQVDVLELAPTLSAMGALIRDAHRAIYPEDPEIVVAVRPFEPGSFDIHTVLSYGTPVLPLLIGQIPKTPKEIYETLKHLGLIAVKGYKSVREVIRVLGGKPDEIKKTRGGFTVKRGDKSQNVNGEVGTLIQDNRTYNNFYTVLAAPIEHGTSQTIKTYLKDMPESQVEVSSQDLPALKEAASGEAPSLQKEKTKTRTIKAALHPRRGSFNEDGHQWSFEWGEQIIVATIKDKKFLKSYAQGETRLNCHDTLHVTLVEKQRIIGDLVESTTYEIKKVNQLVPGPRQQKLLQS